MHFTDVHFTSVRSSPPLLGRSRWLTCSVYRSWIRQPDPDTRREIPATIVWVPESPYSRQNGVLTVATESWGQLEVERRRQAGNP